MKTFREFQEQWTPKKTFNKPPTKDFTDFLRYKDDIDVERNEFKRETGIPLAKNKLKVKKV